MPEDIELAFGEMGAEIDADEVVNAANTRDVKFVRRWFRDVALGFGYHQGNTFSSDEDDNSEESDMGEMDDSPPTEYLMESGEEALSE